MSVLSNVFCRQWLWPRLAVAAVLFATSAVATTTAAAGPNRDKLTVHEWGTFTCLQDDRGQELAGINIDDEPVPKFVHNLAPFLLNQSILTDDHWAYRMNGAPRSHPQVFVRLETPVMYFYPPPGQTTPLKLDVSVQFRGGWLTEFYPKAKADAPGLTSGQFRFDSLSGKTVSGLEWKDLQVGTKGEGPATTEHVWVAPRKVDCANVTANTGESERYLFYRGVAHVRGPLRVAQGPTRGQLLVYANFDEVLLPDQSAAIKHIWFVQVSSKGDVYFRRQDAMNVTGDTRRLAGQIGSDLHKSQAGLAELKKEMHAALVEDGLFADEATAMLATWQRAYFESPGERVFFLVPRVWTDHYLPLKLSQPADVARSMIGRIELVTDEQRMTLKKLAATATSKPDWVERLPKSANREKFMAGRWDAGDLGSTVPEDYRLYMALGRFRNALVVAEEKRNPTEHLTKFINTYGLHPFRVPKR
jgi:hypothetical protein